MSDNTDIWSSIATGELPAPTSSDSVIRAKLNRDQQKKIEQELWESIDNNDPESVRRLLDSGARIEIKRSNITLLYSAVKQDRVEIAKILIEKGANLDIQSARRQPIQTPVFENDSPEMAELLFNHGIDLTQPFKLWHQVYHPTTYMVRTPKMINWWFEKNLPLKFKINKPSHPHSKDPILEPWIEAWSNIAVANWKTDLFEKVRSQIQKTDSNAFLSEAWSHYVKTRWEIAFRNDNAALIQFMAKKGWTPKLRNFSTVRNPTYYLKNQTSDQAPTPKLCFFWSAVSQRANLCMDLLLRSPVIEKAVREDLKNHSENLIFHLPLHAPTLERLVPLGFDLKIQNTVGNVLHNHPHEVTKTFVEWAVKKDPEFVFATNTVGEHAFNNTAQPRGFYEMAQKIHLKNTVGRAPRKSINTPKKARL